MAADGSPALRPVGVRARELLWLGWLYLLGDGVSSLFVPVYLWRISQSLSDVAVWQLFVVLGQLAVAGASAALLRRTGGAALQSAGIVLNALFFACILLLGARAPLWLWLLGLVRGVAIGLYFTGKNIVTYALLPGAARDVFLSRYGMLDSAANLLAPLAAGWIIVLAPPGLGYAVVFLAAAALFASALGFSLRFLPGVEPADPALGLGQALFIPDAGWRRYLAALVLLGLNDGLSPLLITLWLAQVLGSEGILGTTSSLGYLAGLVASLAASVLIKPQNRRSMCVTGALGLAAARALLLGSLPALVVAYQLLSEASRAFWAPPFFSLVMALVRRLDPGHRYYAVLTASAEVPLNLGQAAALLLFLGLLSASGASGGGLGTLEAGWVRVLLILLSLSYLASALLMAPGLPARDRKRRAGASASASP